MKIKIKTVEDWSLIRACEQQEAGHIYHLSECIMRHARAVQKCKNRINK